MGNYRELIVWQKAMELARRVYSATANFPREEVYGLTSQIRRSAVSIPSNIAEGQGRLSKARGSVHELETQVLLALDLGYIPNEAAQDVLGLSSEVSRLLNGMVRSLRDQVLKAGI